jgi:Ca-activated chloride channel family protein
MNNILNPYDVLSVSQSAGFSEIDDAYKKLKARLEAAKAAGSLGANKQLEQVLDAYKLLTDSARLKKYKDQTKDQKNDASFSLRLTPSKRVLETLPEPQVVYVLADIIPHYSGRPSTSRRDAGLNLTLVLDQSNSMTGARLERVKVAATEIINQLTEEDYLSVIGFNDRANVLIEATRVDNKKILASKTRMARAKGGTEILQGLRAGLQENRKNLDPERVNHIILLTDGNTYGDQDACILLANEAAREGISISTLGLGSEWNDAFLDEIASITGGASGFIKSANSVVSFMNGQVNKLARVFTERVSMTVTSETDTEVEMVFKLKPSPQPLPHSVEAIPLGGIQADRTVSVLFQVKIPANIPVGFHNIARIVVTGDVMVERRRHLAARDMGLEVATNAEYEDPPDEILDALGKLTLYHMQERANEALEDGDVAQATERLQNLATRLLDLGEEELAQQTMRELNTLQLTKSLSDEGRKTIKYQTRHLISPDATNEG